jgi:hypothetical protein
MLSAHADAFGPVQPEFRNARRFAPGMGSFSLATPIPPYDKSVLMRRKTIPGRKFTNDCFLNDGNLLQPIRLVFKDWARTTMRKGRTAQMV